MSSEIITVTVESEPHTEDLSGVILNRPAPQGGSFLIDRRLDRRVWSQMKAAGASYWSADDLEDVDMFDAVPGWRYSGAAIEVLLSNGYSLALRGATVTTIEQWRALWTNEAKAVYRTRIAQERQDAERAEQERRAAAAAEREAKGAAYAAWQAEHLTGLVATSIGPDASAGVYGASGPWERIYTAEKGTPGAWYDTGDRWYQNPAGVLRRDYGNASKWYAPQKTVDEWVLACDDGSAAYARHVIEYAGYGVFGSDIADRLVELRGLDHYLALARSEEWLIIAGTSHSRARDVAAHYGIAQTPIALQPYDYKAKERIQRALGYTWSDRNAPSNVGQAADGRWFSVVSTSYTGGGWQLLTAEQCAALNLDTAPPAVAPQMPEARTLPTKEATENMNRRFSEMFSG